MFRLIPFALLAAAALGCGDKPAATQPVAKGGGDGHDHGDHDRGKMKLVDAGPYHAGLTAHMSKDENNIEIVMETQDKEPKPVPLSQLSIMARVERAGDKTYDITFEPGPKEERKGDPDGKCSRFEAKAPWMKPDDKLTVTAKIEIAGKVREVTWEDFNPKKYNHADEEKKK
ncbi:MAG TPA: hypothetical protein VMZ71_11080 [Gemmataceae bacterium]|nr:hypothetical protein [Gemmataceae bacterium]